MGSFSISCTASKLTVGYRDEVYLMPLFPATHAYSTFPTSIVSNEGALIKNTVGPPLLGYYDDYGRVELAEEQNPLIDECYRKAYGDDYKDQLWKIMDREGEPHEQFCVILKDFWDNLVKITDERENILHEYLKAEFFIAHGFQFKPFDDRHKAHAKDHRDVVYYKNYQLEHPDSDIVAFGATDYISEYYYNKKTDSYHKMENKYVRSEDNPDYAYDQTEFSKKLGVPIIYSSPKKAMSMFKIMKYEFEAEKIKSYDKASFKFARLTNSWLDAANQFGLMWHCLDNRYYSHNKFLTPDKDYLKEGNPWSMWLMDKDLRVAADLMTEFEVVYWFMHSNNRAFEMQWCGPQCPERQDELIFHEAVLAAIKKQLAEELE